MKNNRSGQSSILSDGEYSKIRKQIKNQKYRLLLDLAWYTGERWGALLQLLVGDCYSADGTPLTEITFRAVTRKASPDGSRETRQVPIHEVLFDALSGYKPDTNSPWLFPNKAGDRCITMRWADDILRTAVGRAALSAKGISTHSTRRSFITNLHKKGTDVYIIQKITGHKDLKALGRYVEVDADRIRNAIASL